MLVDIGNIKDRQRKRLHFQVKVVPSLYCLQYLTRRLFSRSSLKAHAKQDGGGKLLGSFFCLDAIFIEQVNFVGLSFGGLCIKLPVYCLR